MKFSSQALLIIGSGAWSQKISSIIGKNSKEIIVTIRGAREFLSLDEAAVKKIIANQIVWIATTPKNQIKILNIIKSYDNKVIIEKPFAVDRAELKEFLNLTSETDNKIYLSEPWKHSKIWANEKNLITAQKSPQNIVINRGGPIGRSYISPVWDWIQHDLGLISELLLGYKEEISISFRWIDLNKTLNINLIVPSRFNIEMNIGFFPEKTGNWKINGDTRIDFVNNKPNDDNPVYTMYKYVADEKFINNLSEQVWLTSKIITLLEA